MSQKLKDLNEHNAQARNMQWAMNDNNPRLNGIACPKCGEELYDSNPQQVEYRLHQFFHEQRLNMTLKVGSQEYKPNEWFDVDIIDIEKALQLIFQGEINHYRFDSASKTILPSDYT